MKLLFAFFLIITCSNTQAQDKCPDHHFYKSVGVAESKDGELLMLPLYFKISTDSIIVTTSENGGLYMLDFKITGKECFWNDSLTLGKTVFKTELLNNLVMVHPVVTIIFTDFNDKYIEVMYENGRARFFKL